MTKEKKEVAKNQQKEKASNGNPGNPTPDSEKRFNVQGGEGKDKDACKSPQHKHRIPKNSLFGPYR